MTRLWTVLTLLPLLLLSALQLSAATSRELIAQAVLAPATPDKLALIKQLSTRGEPEIKVLLTAWREDAILLAPAPTGGRIPVVLVGEKDAAGLQAAERVDTGKPLVDAEGRPMRLQAGKLPAAEHTSALRRAMKSVLDLVDLNDPDPAKRTQAIATLGFLQSPEKLPILKALVPTEKDPKAVITLREAIAVTELKIGSRDEKLAALKVLKELHTLSSADFLKTAIRDLEGAGDADLLQAARSALNAVEEHRTVVNFWSTLFRGLSSGSVLLVVAIGLAITFGLMRVINMAHGEMIAVGAYTTYLVQNVFGAGMAISPFGLFTLNLPGMHTTGLTYDAYFLISLPLSFLTAAGVGILLERSVIRFLYRRPLESLLATWGVSLVLQQVFRLIFGSNNVQVSSPSFLSGNFTLHDVQFGWNRLFVIAFAVLIVVGVWLLLTRTPLGLLIRAVMQNRTMASCMGVRTERVNMLTFGLGSGLAGLAGAFISQISNVGPSLGQNYIIDCFMTVVVGGVGNLSGTIISAVGIGMVDQSLQQILLNPVLGKILVLVAIILFLQWRPAGIFVTRGRGLED
ncbi:urea ABC transporter permease subunit UrtB [Nibricoccus sp. IMCC34717]|uniref:urea ABC transporter permease subunit UrtB n=1 Tax=Nibricoccus sp. IMCC34717 TaxID=3034021 RepID=UPI00384F7EDD